MIVSNRFLKFLHNLFFEVEKSIADILLVLPRSGDHENLGQLPVQELPRSTDDCVLWIFPISSIYVSKVNESFADISTELPCLKDFENPKQLPVLKVFEITEGMSEMNSSTLKK